MYNDEQYERIKSWRKRNPVKYSEYEKKRRAKKRLAVITLLGGQCVLCNRPSTKTSLITHEVNGKSPHRNDIEYIVKHLEDFKLLCRPHHAFLHRMKNMGKLDALIFLCSKLG